MTDVEAINKILGSVKPSDVLPDDWKTEYKRISR